MAGHSKWANIKHRKAAKDAKKGAAYAKYCRDVMVAAKMGGADPEANFRLRTAIDKAKSSGIPNDTIDRAVAKGSGQLAADVMETIHYEGYGPAGVAVYIEAMTDNRNRTAGDIRSYFNKFNGNLGETGCVGWIFKETGHIQVALSALSEEACFEKSVEAGADDMTVNEEDDVYDIWTQPDDLNAVCQSLVDQGLTILSAQVTRIPENTVTITDPEHAKPLLRLLDAIEEHDDVQNVYANFDMDEQLLQTYSPA